MAYDFEEPLVKWSSAQCSQYLKNVSSSGTAKYATEIENANISGKDIITAGTKDKLNELITPLIKPFGPRNEVILVLCKLMGNTSEYNPYEEEVDYSLPRSETNTHVPQEDGDYSLPLSDSKTNVSVQVKYNSDSMRVVDDQKIVENEIINDYSISCGSLNSEGRSVNKSKSSFDSIDSDNEYCHPELDGFEDDSDGSGIQLRENPLQCCGIQTLSTVFTGETQRIRAA
eukprot:Pgem_evm1s11942